MASSKPNFIYILADDMGYGDLSCLNPDSKIRTTHLDRLAADGMACRDAHASSAVCTPSRYSLLTGRYNWRSALKQGVTMGYSGPLLEPGRLTVASFLQQRGYQTACIGKWHLGWTWARHNDDTDEKGLTGKNVDFAQPIKDGPTSVGFDYFYGLSASLDVEPYVYVENDRVTALPNRTIPARAGKEQVRTGVIAPGFAHRDVLPNLAQRAVSYIDERADAGGPFFLYFPLTAPHLPILPIDEFLGKSGTNTYGDFCLQVDDVVGQIMAALDRNGLVENTILIFTSDNGCSPKAGFEELQALGHQPSYVFRGYKTDIFEGGHRIPLLIRWPAIIQAGSVSDETVCLVDLLATCADILNESLPDTAAEDSVSDLPVWRGQALDRSLREATVHSSVDGSLAIRKGRWKLEMCPGSGGWSDPRPGPDCEGLPPLQLYDLQTDIGEQHNIAADHPDTVEGLTKLLTLYVRNGRSTPGAPQKNEGGHYWSQLWWLDY